MIRQTERDENMYITCIAESMDLPRKVCQELGRKKIVEELAERAQMKYSRLPCGSDRFAGIWPSLSQQPISCPQSLTVNATSRLLLLSVSDMFISTRTPITHVTGQFLDILR